MICQPCEPIDSTLPPQPRKRGRPPLEQPHECSCGYKSMRLDNFKRHISSCREYKKKNDNYKQHQTIVAMLRDHLTEKDKQISFLNEQLATKDKQLATKDKQLNKVLDMLSTPKGGVTKVGKIINNITQINLNTFGQEPTLCHDICDRIWTII